MQVYDREKINKCHLTLFESSPIPVKGQKYYNGHGWIDVKAMDYLPYGLITYKFDESNNCIVTCEDSYRLSNNHENIPPSTYMGNEMIWRDNIVTPNVDIEFINSDDEIIKAKVISCKSDVIPGVILIGAREHSHSYDYYYKDSMRIFKTGTYLS